MLESIQRSCLYGIYNQRYERSYTNVFDLHFQSQVTDFRFSEILDILNVKIDSVTKSAAYK